MKKILKKIEEVENLNYFLYLIIVLLAGLVFFGVSYFTANKIVEITSENEVDKSFVVRNVSDNGFDIDVKTIDDEVKIRHFIGNSPDTLTSFYETKNYVREDFFQFRSLINGKVRYLQVEFEYTDGKKIRSRVVEVKK